MALVALTTMVVALAGDGVVLAGRRLGEGSATGPPGASTVEASPSADVERQSALTASYINHIPRFAPQPTPQPMALPSGLLAPQLSRVPTTQPVAFVTIDDGWTKVPEAVELIRAARLPVALFLEVNAVRDNPSYFTALQDHGADIEAHTKTHPNLAGRSYEFQRDEICGSTDQLAGMYGRRPSLFRPPFGDLDSTTLRVARDCGLRAVVLWKETVRSGVVHFQEGDHIVAGDIILVHFRTTIIEDLVAALQAIAAAGLVPARLTDYVR